jgi:hypothetical protein
MDTVQREGPRVAARELQFCGGNVERGLRGKSSGLDLDMPLAAVGGEGKDVIPEAVAVIPDHPADAVGQIKMTCFPQLTLLKRDHQLLPEPAPPAVLFLQQPVVDLTAARFRRDPRPVHARLAPALLYLGERRPAGEGEPGVPRGTDAAVAQQNPPGGRAHPPGDMTGVRILRRDRLGGLIHEYDQVA